jgi:putative membrane protein
LILRRFKIPFPSASSEADKPIGNALPHGVSSSLEANGEGVGAEGERLHISGVFVGFITGIPQLIFPIFAGVFGTRKSGSPMLSLGIVLAILLVSLLFRWFAWMRFRYHIGEHDIRIEKGILSRTARSIPYERIQDVSVEQKPLARMMGLGEVKFETGGGEGDDAKLSFVTLSEAERLRELVRARKSGIAVAADQEETVEHVEAKPIFAMDGKRVFTLGLYSFSLVIFAVLGGAAQQLDFLLPHDFWDLSAWIGEAEHRGVNVDQFNAVGWTARIVLAFVALTGLLVIGLASGVIRMTLKEYGFRLDRTDKGFRRRRGLFTLTDVVMPAHRVQAAIVQTGPIRRRRGWHSLKFVSLAQDSKEETNYVAAPFATLAEIWPIAEAAHIATLDGDTEFQHGVGRHWSVQILLALPLILLAMVAVVLFADVSPLRSILLLLLLVPYVPLLWLDWRKYRYALDGSQLYVKRGWWRQQLTIAPQVKIQTIEISQGPISRRQELATLKFGIAGGSLEMVALPLETARAIRDAVMKQVAAVDYSAINQSR